jgi:hypothetical protein
MDCGKLGVTPLRGNTTQRRGICEYLFPPLYLDDLDLLSGTKGGECAVATNAYPLQIRLFEPCRTVGREIMNLPWGSPQATVKVRLRGRRTDPSGRVILSRARLTSVSFRPSGCRSTELVNQFDTPDQTGSKDTTLKDEILSFAMLTSGFSTKL